jgi:ribose transport system permease protein
MSRSEIENVSNSRKRLSSVLHTIINFREGTLLLIILVFGTVIAFMSKNFLTVSNLKALSVGFALEGVAVIGMTLAIITGGLDLSIGSVLALSGVVTGKLFTLGVPIWTAALIGIIIAAVCGLINGLLIGKLGLNAFIATLGMMGIARGICFVITKGTPIALITILPEGFKKIGGGSVFGLPIIVLIFLVIVIVFDLLLRRSSSMRKIFYTGSNEKAAILSGINTNLVKYGVYIASAVLAGIAGVISTARFGVATPTIGSDMGLVLISGAVIGGCSFLGGEGTVTGSVFGVILLALVTNALILMRVSVYWQQLITGLILVGAVAIDHIRNQQREQSILKRRNRKF